MASAKKLLIKRKLQIDENSVIDKDMDLLVEDLMRGEEVEFSLGDFVITKHSNLDHVQLVFHFVVEPSRNERIKFDIEAKKGKLFTNEQLTKLNDGLRNILQVCAEFEVTSLALPIFPHLTENYSNLDESQVTRSVEANLKTIRTFLLQNTRSLNRALKNMTFVIPKGLEGDLLSKVKKTLASFKQT